MTTATAERPDPAEDPQDPKARRPGPAQPPVPQPSAPKPPPKPPLKPVAEAEAYADDPPPVPEAGPPPPLDDRLVGVGRRLQLLVETSTEHLGELRAIAGVLRPDGAAYGRTEGLLQALEFDKEALQRAIAQLHAAAQGIAAERAGRA